MWFLVLLFLVVLLLFLVVFLLFLFGDRCCCTVGRNQLQPPMVIHMEWATDQFIKRRYERCCCRCGSVFLHTGC